MRRSLLLACATGAALCMAASAYAAIGPVRTPSLSSTYHVSFALQDPGWSQIVGGLSGTPALGSYAKELPVSGGRCRVTASLVATATTRKPAVDGKAVKLRPGSRIVPTLRYSATGVRGAVRWWAGRSAGSDAAAGGVQRAPAKLRTKARPWIVYDVRITHRATGAAPGNDECELLSRALAPRVASRIARTMRLASGAPRPHGPYLPA